MHRACLTPWLSFWTLRDAISIGLERNNALNGPAVASAGQATPDAEIETMRVDHQEQRVRLLALRGEIRQPASASASRSSLMHLTMRAMRELHRTAVAGTTTNALSMRARSARSIHLPCRVVRTLHQIPPKAELVVFEQSSHFFLMEEAPKAMATLSDWLKRNTPA